MLFHCLSTIIRRKHRPSGANSGELVLESNEWIAFQSWKQCRITIHSNGHFGLGHRYIYRVKWKVSKHSLQWCWAEWPGCPIMDTQAACNLQWFYLIGQLLSCIEHCKGWAQWGSISGRPIVNYRNLYLAFFWRTKLLWISQSALKNTNVMNSSFLQVMHIVMWLTF